MKSHFALIIILFQFATVLSMADSGVNNKLCVLKAKQLLELSTREDQQSIEISDDFTIQNSRKNQPQFGDLMMSEKGVIYRRENLSASQSVGFPSLAKVDAAAPGRKIKSISLFYTDKLGSLDNITSYEFSQYKNTCIPNDLADVIARPEFQKECTIYFNDKTRNEFIFSESIHLTNCKDMIATNSEVLFLPSKQKATKTNSPQGTR